MRSKLVFEKEYKIWLTNIKVRIRSTQIKAALRVNTELLKLYWSIGADIVAKQRKAKWGDGLVDQLSKDLSAEFPGIKGFSRTNLLYVRKWYLFYFKGIPKVPQVVGQMKNTIVEALFQIPWGHNREIISNCQTIDEALFYVQNTIKHNWSRNVLIHQIESKLFKRKGKAISNFALTLPKSQSDLAHQTLKDPYVFDFLSMSENYNERDLENKLTEHLTGFLLELGAGFAFVGK